MVRRRDCMNVYRALHESEAPSALRSQFRSRDESLRHTRASASGLSSLHLPRVRLAATQHQFNYRATKSWNELPPEAANALSRRSFMTILKSYPPVTLIGTPNILTSCECMLQMYLHCV